jgi:putative ABC transport system substrate-binding protein
MTTRRTVLATLSTGMIAWPWPLAAQSGPMVPSVCFFALAGRDRSLIEAFEQGLREQGRIPGETIRIVELYGEGSRERMRSQLAELFARGTRVFVTAGPNAARMVHEVSNEAAIVVASLESIEAAGVGSISRPEGNVTGFATMGGELNLKRLELLREIKPGLRRVVAVVNPKNRDHPHRLAAAQHAARALGVELLITEIVSREAIDAGLKQASAAGAEAAIFFRDFLFETFRSDVVAAAAAAQLPAVYDESAFVQLGGLMSYSPSRPDLFRRSAEYVVKILDGAKPADLPIQLPTKFELAINLRTAKALGLAVPPTILLRADEVIE